MTHTASRRAVRRAPKLVLAGLAITIAVLVGVLSHPSGSSSATSFRELLRPDPRGALSEADGVIPEDTSVFDTSTPAVANLDVRLRKALRRAAAEASEDGVELYVNSGWRSRAYQERLLQEAISRYGSRASAARWVATPSTSPHVSGDAVDIGRSDAVAWLSAYGAAYGLCQVYGNEPWHYELQPDAVDHGCPPTYADPTHDPRMQQ